MNNVVLIAIGGALGSILRYGIQKLINTSFPTGTLTVNIAGCFLIGWLWALSVKGLNEEWRLFLMTGFCGGFTTFSAFTLEGVQMMMSDRWMIFLLYVIGSVAGGLLATFLAYKIFS